MKRGLTPDAEIVLQSGIENALSKCKPLPDGVAAIAADGTCELEISESSYDSGTYSCDSFSGLLMLSNSDMELCENAYDEEFPETTEEFPETTEEMDTPGR